MSAAIRSARASPPVRGAEAGARPAAGHRSQQLRTHDGACLTAPDSVDVDDDLASCVLAPESGERMIVLGTIASLTSVALVSGSDYFAPALSLMAKLAVSETRSVPSCVRG